mgnify:CR=1 FL=1
MQVPECTVGTLAGSRTSNVSVARCIPFLSNSNDRFVLLSYLGIFCGETLISILTQIPFI